MSYSRNHAFQEKIVPGKKGPQGFSAYELAVRSGFLGTLEAWLESLGATPGEKGEKGDQGIPGANGTNGTNGTNGASWVNWDGGNASSISNEVESFNFGGA
jgi:hypothetical protein